MGYLVNQISNIVNDAVKDALGKNVNLSELNSTDLVSLGKKLDKFEAYDGFFKSLANRIVKTVYFVRTYEGSSRHILRDEQEYGAFIQKVYYELPEAVDSATWDIPNKENQYHQSSPYDVEGTITVSAMTFGGKGTWDIEITRPIEQIKSAFLSASAMSAFIDGIYIAVENAFKLEEERIVSLAANTGMANALVSTKKAQKRNLLLEYNTAHNAELTVAQALESADFLKFASMEINRTICNLNKMTSVYNSDSYTCFTPKDMLVVELLSHFASASDMYLQADTFHNELTKLPNFETVPYWQGCGEDFSFEKCSSINISHSDINEGAAIKQSGIICFLHDIEYVAAYFGNRRSWELVNPRSEVIIHGEKAEKGFAVDGHANAIVFYMA